MSSSRHPSQRVIHGPLDECYTCGAKFLYHEQVIQHMTEEGHWPTCEFCGDRFRRVTQLELHLEAKHYFWCKDCGKTFATQRGLVDHMAAKGHQGPTHKCRQCNSMFATPGARDSHQTDKAFERKVTIVDGLEANMLPGTDIMGPEKFDMSLSRGQTTILVN
ncbi:hypothetical protein ACHAO4_009497 [Trichoderma viride]